LGCWLLVAAMAFPAGIWSGDELRGDGSYPTVLTPTGNRASIQIDSQGAVQWDVNSDNRITDNALVGEPATQANFYGSQTGLQFFCQFRLFNATALFGLCSVL
jgi:hypothetical protein